MSELHKSLTGAWELVSYRRFRDGVFYRDTMGPSPSGRLFYSASGYMSAFLLSAEWARGEKVPFTWQTFLSYSARWQLLDDATIAHDVDMASLTEFIGRRLVRYISWTPEGDLCLLTDGHTTSEGHHSQDRLLWRRIIDA